MSSQPTDSTGRTLRVGDKVRYKGAVATIRRFHFAEDTGPAPVNEIEFEEPELTGERALETQVDFVAVSDHPTACPIDPIV